MLTKEQARTQLQKRIATQSDSALVDLLVQTDAKLSNEKRGSDEWKATNIVRLTLMDELESRHDVNDQMQEWSENLDDTRSCVQALLDALKEETCF